MYRGRRLRRNKQIRAMVRETMLRKEDLIQPIFVVEGEQIYREIKTMPGVYHYSIDKLSILLDAMVAHGIVACLLFGIPKHKDAYGSEAYATNGIVQKAIRYIKEAYPSIYVIGDVCMCEYTDHGHCGILNEQHEVDNDTTLTYLNRIALSYAQAGIDMVAPSDMMDGHITSIRKTLDDAGYTQIPIMGYSAKYASNFYGPFREAADSTPSFGDRKSYQMDFANRKEALREIQADVEEGVDVIMVKPAMAYLDIVAQAKMMCKTPLCVYHVSGEYAMLVYAIQAGLLHEDALLETIWAMKRAGADLIITYAAMDIAKRIETNEVGV